MPAVMLPPEFVATAEEAKSERSRPYEPHGSASELMRCKLPEVLMSGMAGTGKSRACLEKLHRAADVHPGMRGLIVRKTRESLTESALVTFEQHVVQAGHPILEAGGQRRMRQSYQYPNGSVIVVGGMDKPSKVMSTEYDLIYANEAIELFEADWESLTTRLRNGKMPYQQILADTNPDSPTHWIKLRCNAGKTRMIECRHEDNPVLYDRKAKKWTKRGEQYIAMLDNLTGPRKDRLRYGRWVQAEGIVYTNYSAAIHLIDRFPIPRSWRRFLSIDFGYTNPFVCQWWAMDDDNRLYRYRELYRTQRLVEEHAADIMAVSKEMGDSVDDFIGVVCDHDAEGRATLEKHMGRSTRPASKEVREGIDAVSARLKVQGDGKPRLFMLRDSLVGRDPRLEGAKKPCCTDEEWDSYIWDKEKSRNRGEEPVKENDHGLDCLRYGVRFADSGAGQGNISGSDPTESILHRLPSDAFHDDDGGGSIGATIFDMRF